METNKNIQKCFIITPIGSDNSPIRRKTDGLLNNVIKPICAELNYKAIPAHEIDNSGSITNQVIQGILNSKMVIANLTGLNPNVMYELAIRHAAKLPVVCIAEYGTTLPFDITTERTIFYTDDMAGAELLKIELRKKLKNAIDDSNIDNPVYRAVKEETIIKQIQLSDPKDSSALEYIIKRLDKLEVSIQKDSLKNNHISSNIETSNYNDYTFYKCAINDDSKLNKIITNLRRKFPPYFQIKYDEGALYIFTKKIISLDDFANHIEYIVTNNDLEFLGSQCKESN